VAKLLCGAFQSSRLAVTCVTAVEKMQKHMWQACIVATVAAVEARGDEGSSKKPFRNGREDGGAPAGKPVGGKEGTSLSTCWKKRSHER